MNDLTILYYTANTIPDITAEKVRNNLLKTTNNQYPIISVSQKPINFGKNICVGEIGRSKYNCYKQILIGAENAKTKYVACAEDDVLYSPEHFLYRPKEGVFAYELSMWFAQPGLYWRLEQKNERNGMWGCVCETETLVKNLSVRYKMFPSDPLPKENKDKSKYSHLIWGEPGKNDQLFGLTNNLATFESKEPTLVFLYRESMGGRQIMGRYNTHTPENVSYNLKTFGSIGKLWNAYWSDK